MFIRKPQLILGIFLEDCAWFNHQWFAKGRNQTLRSFFFWILGYSGLRPKSIILKLKDVKSSFTQNFGSFHKKSPDFDLNVWLSFCAIQIVTVWDACVCIVIDQNITRTSLCTHINVICVWNFNVLF